METSCSDVLCARVFLVCVCVRERERERERRAYEGEITRSSCTREYRTLFDELDSSCVCVCVCVCVTRAPCARARARVRVCVRAPTPRAYASFFPSSLFSLLLEDDTEWQRLGRRPLSRMLLAICLPRERCVSSCPLSACLVPVRVPECWPRKG